MKVFESVVGILVMVMVIVAGCSHNATPGCPDEAVQGLVLEIASDELFKQLLPEELQANYAKIIEEAKDSAIYVEYEKVDPQGQGYVWGTMPAEQFLKFTQVSQVAATLKERIASRIQEMRPSLAAIRLNSEDPDTGKVSCEANLVFANGNSLPIRYSAQPTEDKQLWVEVSGL